MPKTKEVGFSPTLVSLNLRVVNGRVVQPNHGKEFSDVGIVFGTVTAHFLGVFFSFFFEQCL